MFTLITALSANMLAAALRISVSVVGSVFMFVFCLAPKVIENGSAVYTILQEKSKKFVFLVKSMVAGR
jgi:uncharacterized membrane protein